MPMKPVPSAVIRLELPGADVRHIGAADAGEKAGHENGAGARAFDADAGGIERRRLSARRLQIETDMAVPEQPAHHRHRDDREIDERMVLKQGPAR